jgi:hypothetical protein
MIDVPAGDVAALVAAITTANANGEADTITLARRDLQPGRRRQHAVVGRQRAAVVTSPITIEGNGAILERGAGAVGGFRHLTIDGGGHLTVNDLTIRNGTTGTAGQDGGAVYVRSGTLAGSGCTFTNNHCAGVCLGGAIHLQANDSVVDLRDSVLSENSSAEGGAIDVFSNGTLTLTRVRVVDNEAHREPSLVDGGGIARRGRRRSRSSTARSAATTPSDPPRWSAPSAVASRIRAAPPG